MPLLPCVLLTLHANQFLFPSSVQTFDGSYWKHNHLRVSFVYVLAFASWCAAMAGVWVSRADLSFYWRQVLCCTL